MEDQQEMLDVKPTKAVNFPPETDKVNSSNHKNGQNSQSRPSLQRSNTIFTFNYFSRNRNQIQRVVNKAGVCNMIHTHVKYRSFQFLSDSFTTMIDLRWRYTLCLFTLSYVLSWFLFGILWYIFAYAHGDVGRSFNTEDDFDPCVYNVETFVGAFLFSLETQTTIGYGFRSVSEACPHAALLVVVQSVISYLINSIMLGLIFAKLARPKKRVATLKFSRHACIAKRNGKLCLMFRVGNIRNTSLFEAHVRAFAIKPKITDEGEYIPLHYYNLDLNYETGEDRIVLMWPLIVCHYIDEKSPLYSLTADDIKQEDSSVISKIPNPSVTSQNETPNEANIKVGDFEILVLLEGVVEQTGLVTQARTSYLPFEIKWGHRFSSQVITLRSKADKQFRIDYENFNSMYEVPNFPSHSAKQLDEQLYSPLHQYDENDTSQKDVNGTQKNPVNGTQQNHANGKQQNHTNGMQNSPADNHPVTRRKDDILERNQNVMIKTLQDVQKKLKILENTMENNQTVLPTQDPQPAPLIRQSAIDSGHRQTNDISAAAANNPPTSKSTKEDSCSLA